MAQKARLIQHLRGKTLFDASLAYRMARKKKCPPDLEEAKP
jgi:hypothetical protein